MSAGASGNGDSQNVGQLPLTGENSPLNQHAFLFRQLMGEMHFHFIAEIVKVYNRNSLTEPCTVDIKPVLSDQDGLGQAQAPGIVYGIPVPRNQSGGSVFINDPSVGDRANFSVLSRDHSSSQANDWQSANPGSFRRSTLADAVFQSVLPRKSQPVTQHFMFTDTGIDCADMNKNTFNSSSAGWNFNGAIIDQKGNFTAPGNVTAGKGSADQVDLQGHAHGNSGPPTAGT